MKIFGIKILRLYSVLLRWRNKMVCYLLYLLYIKYMCTSIYIYIFFLMFHSLFYTQIVQIRTKTVVRRDRPGNRYLTELTPLDDRTCVWRILQFNVEKILGLFRPTECDFNDFNPALKRCWGGGADD